MKATRTAFLCSWVTLWLAACGSSSPGPNGSTTQSGSSGSAATGQSSTSGTNSGSMSGGAQTGSPGGSGSTVTTGSSAGAVSGSMGTTGATSGGSGSGSSDASTASGNGSGASGANDASTPQDSASPLGEGGGPIAVAGCANNSYPVCLDFETPLGAAWSGATNAVQMGNAAHGMSAFHYKPGGLLHTTQLGAITNIIWGRIYLHMHPTAPGGHGELIGAYDQAGNWYEIGWQFKGLLGNWHGDGGEKPVRGHPVLPDRYVCVEFLFDGSTAAMPRMWMDGQEVQYYMLSTAKGPEVVKQFMKFEVGYNDFAGPSLNLDGGYGGNAPPIETDTWIDDVALDVKRIGCIAP